VSGSDTKQLADVVVGARGWLHQSWLESYYPEDIPDEWRLGYYGNEFNTVLVPWEQWQVSVEALEEGLDDTSDDFHLYLELPEAVQPLPAHLSEILDRITGLVCTKGEATGWQEPCSVLNVALFSLLPNEKSLLNCFRASGNDKLAELVLVDKSTGIDDLALMREQLELVLGLADKRLDLIFVDETPALDSMRNTQMIAELLGA